ncbi:unnamed protein product [Lymnaea stagnalis]|uniref:Mitochondria-eating protein n=1 Tax=Lymnaea stagnalis TaxID=6523 RepID=A0AAV2H0J5_LYMST
MAASYVKRKRTADTQAQKVWRSASWLGPYPGKPLSLSASDLTSSLSERRLSSFFERKRFVDCAILVKQLRGNTLSSVLSEIPIAKLHAALPDSLPLVEALYLKVYHTPNLEFPTSLLMTDQLLKRMVTFFALSNVNKTGERIRSYLLQCRTIVGIIVKVDPSLRNTVLQRKLAVDRCLRNMGRHGMVGSSGGKLMTLHDALKIELEKMINQYKYVIQKLEDLSLSAKHPVPVSVSSGAAPTEASHQRLMQINRKDVLDRVTKNKRLLNLMEPVVSGRYFRKLVAALERRIEYDKVLLFHDTELIKMSEIDLKSEPFLGLTLNRFSKGYGVLLDIMAEILGETTVQKIGVNSSDDDEEVVLETAQSIMDRMHMQNLKGGSPRNGMENNHMIDGRRGRPINPEGHGSNTPRDTERLDRPVSTPARHPTENRYINRPDIALLSSSIRRKALAKPYVHETRVMDETVGSERTAQNGILERGATSGVTKPDEGTTLLEQEIRYLREELAVARDQIIKLQDKEKQLRERLADQVHAQFTTKPSHVFEDLSLGPQRPTVLVRAYDDLYREGRVDTLDALDSLPELHGLDILKMKILFSVVVLSFRCVQQALENLKGKLRHLLCLPVIQDAHQLLDPASAEMERHISNYLIKTTDHYNIGPIVHEVCQNIYATLYDYPGLKTCAGLTEYTKSTVKLAWGLSVQDPPYLIAYESRRFKPQCHVRFHTSDSDSEDIKSFLWPFLIDGHSGQCVAKGVVIT